MVMLRRSPVESDSSSFGSQLSGFVAGHPTRMLLESLIAPVHPAIEWSLEGPWQIIDSDRVINSSFPVDVETTSSSDESFVFILSQLFSEYLYGSSGTAGILGDSDTNSLAFGNWFVHTTDAANLTSRSLPFPIAIEVETFSGGSFEAGENLPEWLGTLKRDMFLSDVLASDRSGYEQALPDEGWDEVEAALDESKID